MKTLFRLLGIIAFAAIIGFSMTACGGDDDPPPDPKDLVQGTWKYTWASGTNWDQVAFTGNNYVIANDEDDPLYSGTFTITSNTITFAGQCTDTVTYSISGNNLTITGDSECSYYTSTPLIYTKQP